jgi:hypothetical protein
VSSGPTRPFAEEYGAFDDEEQLEKAAIPSAAIENWDVDDD